MKKTKVAFSWSGGKDSAFALYKLLNDTNYEVICLFTTVSAQYNRVAMHGISIDLLELQAKAIGLPLKTITIKPSNKDYENSMEKFLTELKKEGISTIAHGDIFLEDLKEYRETMLAKVGMKAVFPLWKQETSDLIKEFIALGFKTITCSVASPLLGEKYVGKIIDTEFISSLPEGVDVCGENGEFHTFVIEGPLFANPLPVKVAEKVYKPLDKEYMSETIEGFWYADIVIE